MGSSPGATLAVDDMGLLRERVPVERSPLDVYRALDGNVLLENHGRGWTRCLVAAEPLEAFRYQRGEGDGGFRELEAWVEGFTAPELTAFGFLGYDLWKEEEPEELEAATSRTRRDHGFPDIAFDLFDTWVEVRADDLVVEAVDHPRQDHPPRERAERWVQRLREEAPAPPDAPEVGEAAPDMTPEAYRAMVEAVKREVREGNTFQANVSQRLSLPCRGSPEALYHRLRVGNPAPYMGLYEMGGRGIVSTSPELLVRRQGDELETRPIAGTRPRGGTPEEDARMRRELAEDAKEQAEHSILVDLARNDLGAVSRYGSVVLDPVMEVTTYPSVLHLESVVRGRAREEAGVGDVLRAMFPGGTVTGAPKPRTLRIIEEQEPTERGPYTGSMGWIRGDGDLELNILIRTVLQEGERCTLQVGGGIVEDSVPEREREETLNKARGALHALNP